MDGCEPSRRNDLVSLGYIWVYLFKHGLHWQSRELAEREDRLAAICRRNKSVSLEDLCFGMPIEFVRYFETVRGFELEEESRYAELQKLFRNLFIRSKFVYDGQWDWVRGARGTAKRPTRLSLSLLFVPQLNQRMSRSAPSLVKPLLETKCDVEEEHPVRSRNLRLPREVEGELRWE
jgi:hypothetical protein